MSLDFTPSRRLMTELYRTNFSAFLAKVFETVSKGDTFHLNWHLDAIAWELGLIEAGKSTRLLVTMPPRNLKSIAISIAWVAWVLGQRPSTRFICASYSDKLVHDLADKCREVMLSDWYRAAFPRTVLRGRAPANDFRTTLGGGRYATSVGGTLTGRGGDIIIIDDPIKPTDAVSPVIRQSNIDWYANTLVSRLNNKKTGAIVLVMQRVHAEDLAGHVLAEGGWNHLNLPAIATGPDRIQIGPHHFYERSAGVPLNPAHEDIPELLRQRRITGSLNFSGQYQQAPIPAGGLLVKAKWLRYYDTAPTRQDGDLIVQSWDTASKDNLTNDFSSCVTALVRGREVFILDVFRGRLQFPALVAKALELARAWKVKALLIEEAVSGVQLIQALRDPKIRDIPSPIGRTPAASKEARLWGQTVGIEAGNLILPASAVWVNDFVAELLGFPRARYDDQVDALVHLLAWSGERRNTAPVNAGPEIIFAGEYQTPDIYDSGYIEDPWSGLY